MSAAVKPDAASGPLTGIRVVEFGGIGPGPYCGQLLAEMGAEVLVIDREGGNGWSNPVTDHGKARLALDIRSDEGRSQALDLIALADVLIEGFRPGVMERLGLGPDVALDRNARLVYGRMTGWGQTGPLAQSAGHDLNYIAVTRALAGIGRAGEPSVPPLNLIGDFGGGSLFLALGIACALVERGTSGQGQVIDAAIVDGVASMMSFFSGLQKTGSIRMERDRNLLAGAAPFYRCYECSDGKQVAVGALEPQFFRQLVEKIGAPAEWLKDQNDPTTWPERSAAMAAIFLTKSRAEWCDLLEGTDACFAGVLDLEESELSPHLLARQTIVEIDGVKRPAPAPRFSRTPGSVPAAKSSDELIKSWQRGSI